jgi:hypothetical protein
VSTPGAGRESPREELARLDTESYAKFSQLAADPELSAADQEAALLIRDLLASISAASAEADVRITEQEQRTADLAAILLGDDIGVLAAALRRRLTAAQIADLIVRLSSADPVAGS